MLIILDYMDYLLEKSASRFNRHSEINLLVKRTLASACVTSCLEPKSFVRSDGKRLDGMTSVPWSRGKALVWDVTVVDSLSRSRAGSPHLAVEEAEKKKLAKYKEISNSGSIFQPVVFDTQGNYGPETLSFLDKLLNKLISTTSETRARSFFVQKQSILLLRLHPPAPPAQHKSACILGILNVDTN